MKPSWTVRAIFALVILAFLASCRAAAPATGSRFETIAVAPGPRFSTDRSFTSTDANLGTLQGRLRGTLGGLVDLKGAGNLAWAFAGTTEEFVATGTSPAHRAVPRTLGTTATFSTPVALFNEVATLRATPVIGSIFGPGGGGGDPPSDPSLLRYANLSLDPDAITVSWVAGPTVGSATSPALRIRTRYTATFDEIEGLAGLVDVQSGSATYDHDIALTPCVGTTCRDAAPAFTAYRSIDTRLGADAVMSDTGLAFTHTASAAGNTVGASISPFCPFIITEYGALLVSILADFRSDVGQLLTFLQAINSGPIAGGATPFITSIACILLADATNEELDTSLADNAGSLDAIGDVLVNPPSFRVSLEQALVGAGFDTRPMGGDGFIDSTEATPALTMLGVPASSAGGLALILSPMSPPRAGTSSPIQTIMVSLDVAGSIRAGDGAPADAMPSAIVAPDGSLTDRTVLAMRRGTVEPMGPGSGDVTISTLRLDLRPLRRVCEAAGPRAPTNFGGICGVCGGPLATPALCDGTRIRDFAQIMGPGGTPTEDIPIPAGTLTPFAIQPSPGLAALLETAPLFGQTLRELFANAVPAGARYTSATFAAGPPGTATFGFTVDPDYDAVDSRDDNCDEVFNPTLEDDGDGDALGAACDGCIGLRARGALDNEDRDGDGIANQCDCDQDDDGCFAEGSEIDSSGMVVPCVLPPGTVSDELPGRASTSDFDGDGIADDCDPDHDNDGVPNDADNCPFGDGDDEYEPRSIDIVTGAIRHNDQNGDQTDSGTSELGDLCDPVCPPLCIASADEFGIPPEEPFFGFDIRDFFPLPFECIDRDCGLGLFAFCGGSIDDCISSEAPFVATLTSAGRAITGYGGPNAPPTGSVFGVAITQIPDMTGDGIFEVALGTRDPMQGPVGNNPNLTNAVRIVDGSSGQEIDALTAGSADDGFGSAVARNGDFIAIGAPFARDSTGSARGAVYIFAVRERLALVATVYGRSAGSRFGTSIGTVSTKRGGPQFLVGAPAAAGPAGARVGEIARVDPRRGILRWFVGGIAGGEMSRAIAIRDRGGRATIVGAAPLATSGAGALFLFDAQGNRRRVVRGSPGERLGTALLDAPAIFGEGIFGVGAPGYGNGRGALLRYDLIGRRRAATVWVGHSFGAALAVGGDANGDGASDLLVGYSAVDANGAERTFTLPIYWLPPR